MKLSLLTKALLTVMVCVSGTFRAAADDQIFTNKTTTSSKFNKEIQGIITWIGADDQEVDYSGNNVKYTGTSSTWQIGGALGMNNSYTSETKLTIKDYGEVSFSQNNSESTNGKTRAAAIAMHSANSSKHSLVISGNGDVTFQDNVSTAAKDVSGSAVHVGKNAVADITGNTNVTFQQNKAESTVESTGTAYGSIYIDGGNSSINLSENTGHVLFAANKVINGKQHAYGGAIAISSDTSTAVVENNAKLSFTGNYVKVGSADTSGVMSAGGGAIYEKSASFSIANNTEVIFEGNYAYSANGKDTAPRGGNYSARGGAIYSGGIILNDETTRDDNSAALAITDNVQVKFTGNYVQFDGEYSASNDTTGAFGANGAPKVAGGAIFAENGIKIQGNDNVLFSGNYEKTPEGYRLRAIYSVNSTYVNIANDRNQSYVKLTPSYLSVNEGGSMLFQDGITLNGNSNNASSPIHLNSDYNGKSQTGKIIFTGRYTESLLQGIKDKDNAGPVTESEIANSRCFEMNGDTTLYAGTLSLQDDAVMQATKLTIKNGATIEAVRTNDEAALVFGISAQDAELLSPAATLSADLMLEDGAMVSLNGGNIDMDEHSLTLNGSLAVTLSNDLLGEDEIVLFSNVKTLTGNLSDIIVNGVTTTGSFSNGDVIINIADVPNIPEPATTTLSLLALAGLAARRRRK